MKTGTCIKCGKRGVMAKLEVGKAFANRYCVPCAAKLPVLPVITEVRA